MSEYPWLKLWNEALEDAKFDAAADMAGSTPAVATVAFLRACAYANEHDRKNGSFAGLNLQVIASRLRVPLAEIKRLFDAYRELGMMIGHKLVNWAKRQLGKLPKPRSLGAERTAKWRAAAEARAAQEELKFEPAPPPPKPAAELIPSVTFLPEASHSTVTTGADLDSDLVDSSNEESTRARRASHAEEDFQKWYEGYPHKVGRAAARKACDKALRLTSLDELIAATERYKTQKPPDRDWCNPATWLNQQRWLDVPATSNVVEIRERLRVPTAPPPAELLAQAHAYLAAAQGEGRLAAR
jgi:hypothetical protein